MMFRACVSFYNGSNYETGESWNLNAQSLEDAIQEIEKADFGYDGDYDIKVEILDEEGDGLWAKTIVYSEAEEKQNQMDHTWESDCGYTTECLGLLNDEWYVWEKNGGSEGGHDRTNGSGRWVEEYERPVKVNPRSAMDWLMEHQNMSPDEAIEDMAEHCESLGKDDLIREIGDCLWREGNYTGVYRVRGTMYTVAGFNVEIVNDAKAIRFVSERDKKAVEEFEEMLG